MEGKPSKKDKAKAYVSLEMEEKKTEDVEEGKERREESPPKVEEQLEDEFDHLFWLKVGSFQTRQACIHANRFLCSWIWN